LLGSGILRITGVDNSTHPDCDEDVGKESDNGGREGRYVDKTRLGADLDNDIDPAKSSFSSIIFLPFVENVDHEEPLVDGDGDTFDVGSSKLKDKDDDEDGDSDKDNDEDRDDKEDEEDNRGRDDEDDDDDEADEEDKLEEKEEDEEDEEDAEDESMNEEDEESEDDGMRVNRCTTTA